MTRKRTAALASICVFAVGMVGFYLLAGAIKDRFSELATYVITMAAFGVVCGISYLTERLIYQPPDKPPFDQNRN
jgi:MFS family permease